MTDMSTKTINISKHNVKTEFEALTWKYANSIDAENSSKPIHNMKPDRVDDAVDAFVVDAAFDRRMNEVSGFMSDFSATASESNGDVVLTFTVTSRWSGSLPALQSLVKTYVLDGMMAEWLNLTAPGEAAIYTTKLPQDIQDIKAELYKKGART